MTGVTRAARPRCSTLMTRDHELALVARLKAGDADAFDEVHAGFNARLLTFLARLARRRDVAEDLLEETWLRFVTHASRLDDDTRLAAWLFTVARNLHVSYRRARFVEEAAVGTGLSLWPTAPAQASPFEETAANELEARLERAVAELAPASREVLLLIAVAGLDHADAADVCGTTPQALRQRLHRARAALARALADDQARSLAALQETSCPTR